MASSDVPGELLVGLDGVSKRSSLAQVDGVELLEAPALERMGVVLLRLTASADEATVVNRLATLPGVRFVEPNIVIHPAGVPSDPLYGGVSGEPTDLQKWVFGGVGENTVLNAEAAWDVTHRRSVGRHCGTRFRARRRQSRLPATLDESSRDRRQWSRRRRERLRRRCARVRLPQPSRRHHSRLRRR